MNTHHPGLPDYAGPTEGWFYLLHHDGPIIEWSDDVMKRIEYIRSNKPEYERQQRLLSIAWSDPEAWPEYLRKAYAEWEKAYTEWESGDAEWAQACAKWEEADAKSKWDRPYAEWAQACAKRREADAEWAQACAKWQKAISRATSTLTKLHKALCPETTWNGRILTFKEDSK